LAAEQGAPLDGPTLLGYVAEVADALPDDGVRRRLVVVGGALLAWHELRESTHDVDSAERLEPAFEAAVAQVGARHGLAATWINAAASRFLPVGFDPSGGEVILDHPKLVVLGADLDQVLLMKIFAGRESDTDDLGRLWPLTTFTTIAEVLHAYRAAYPHDEDDPFLASYLEGIVGEGNGT